MASTLSSGLAQSRSSTNIRDDSGFQPNTNSFVKKLGFKFFTKSKFQLRSKSRRGSLADGTTNNNNPYSQSGPGSRATRSMDILRKTQPFASMLAVNTAAYLGVDGDADALRHSMDDSGRSSSSREWKASLQSDVGGKGSVAQGLALVASAETGVHVEPVHRASLAIDHSACTRDGVQPERQGALRARSDHAHKHSVASVLPTSINTSDARCNAGDPSNAGRLQSGPGSGVGCSSLEADGTEANTANKDTSQSESHKRSSTGLAPISLARGSQHRGPLISSPASPSYSRASTSSPSTSPSIRPAANSHQGLLTTQKSSMETLRAPASSASFTSTSVSTTTKDAAARPSILSTPARAPAPRLSTLPSLPPLTTTFSHLKRVTESPTTTSSLNSNFLSSEPTPTSTNAMQQLERQKAAALAFSGGVRLSPSVIVRAPPFPILPLPPTSPTAETPRVGVASRSFRSASMSAGIPSSSLSISREDNTTGPSSEGRREGRRTAARLNSMPLLPMEGASNEEEAEDDGDHMLEDDMIGEEEEEDTEGDPRMSSESAGMGSASDDEDGFMEDDTPGASSSKNPFRSPSGRPFLPKPKRDMSFSAFLGLDVKGKDKELLPTRSGPGPATPKASQLTKKREKNGEKERDYFSFLVSPPSIASSTSVGSGSTIASTKDKSKDRDQERDRAFEREIDSALRTPTAADFRSDSSTPHWSAAADYSSTAMWREVKLSSAEGEESFNKHGTGKRPGFYHQVSKSMVDLVHLSRPTESATNAKSSCEAASGASNVASTLSADLANSDDRSSRARATPRFSTANAADEQLYIHGNIPEHGNPANDLAKEVGNAIPGVGIQERDGAVASATAPFQISLSANGGLVVQDAKILAPSHASDHRSPLTSPTTTTTFNSLATAAASASPTIRRQRSMPTFTSSGPPPPYPSFLLSPPNGSSHPHAQLLRFGMPLPRDEEGREELPPYSNDIKLSAILPRKLEFAAPGKPARDRKWRRVHVVLEGTSFRVYNVPHTVAGVSAVTGWWESKVGVGDIAQGNGITASGETRGVVIGNTGVRENKKRSKWEEELELRAQEEAEAQSQAQQGRASVTIERASMDSQSSGSHQPQQSKSKRQLANLLHPNRSRISVNSSARSQPTSPAASPLSTPRSSLQIIRPSVDLSTSASAPSISNMNPTSSIYGNVSAASSTLVSSSSSSMMSSSTQIASSSSQTSHHSHSRSHFRLHHRRNESAPLAGASKDTSNKKANSSHETEKEKEASTAIPDPNPKDLIREYTLQHAESGLASDYFKRKNVLRVRMEGEQFLLQARDVPEVVEWIEGLQAASNIALDLDERPMPKGPIYPRRRRRRRAQRVDASADQSTTQNSTS